MKSLLSLLLGFTLLIASTVVADDLPTPDEIRERLYNWRKDLITFRIRYENTWPHSSHRILREFTMTDTKEYLDFEDWYGFSEMPYRKTSGGDATNRFQAHHELKADGAWELTSVKKMQRKTSNVGSSRVIQPLWPLFYPHAGTWIDERIFEHKVTVKEGGMIDGEECILLEVEYLDEVEFAGDQIWLAINKDYLPKQAAPLKSEVLQNPHYYCAEYKTVSGRWYPFRGQSGQEVDSSVNLWEVTEFEVNPKVSSSLFKPPSDSQLLKRKRLEKKRSDNVKSRQESPKAILSHPPDAEISWIKSYHLSAVLFSLASLVMVLTFWWGRRS